MTYSYKSTDQLEKGDYLYTPDFYLFPDYGVHQGVSPYAVWNVTEVTRYVVVLILMGSKDWVNVSTVDRDYHYSITIKPEGREHGGGKWVRFIGKQPPWDLEVE